MLSSDDDLDEDGNNGIQYRKMRLVSNEAAVLRIRYFKPVSLQIQKITV